MIISSSSGVQKFRNFAIHSGDLEVADSPSGRFALDLGNFVAATANLLRRLIQTDAEGTSHHLTPTFLRCIGCRSQLLGSISVDKLRRQGQRRPHLTSAPGGYSQGVRNLRTPTNDVTAPSHFALENEEDRIVMVQTIRETFWFHQLRKPLLQPHTCWGSMNRNASPNSRQSQLRSGGRAYVGTKTPTRGVEG